MSDDPVRTRIVLAGEGEPEVAFQHYFVRLAHSVPVRAIRFAGADDGRARARASSTRSGRPRRSWSARRIPWSPSLLSSPWTRSATFLPHAARMSSPSPRSWPGRPSRGRRTACWPSWATNRRWWAWPACMHNWVGTLVIDEADASLAVSVERAGLRCIVAPTIMSDRRAAAALARRVLDFRV